MHATLQPKTNIVLLAIWAGVTLAVALMASPVPWLFLGMGAGLGLLAGILQLRALRETPEALIATQTAMDVRRVLRSSRFGRLYIYTFWLSMILLFFLALFLLGDRAIAGYLGGYASFALVRECLTLPAGYELRKFLAEQRK